jgi:hypothetical protein
MAQPQDAGGASRIGDTTRNLVESVLLDVWPRQAAIAEFGIRTQEHLEALYHPLRHGEITPEQVDAARGDGRQLTELVNAAPHNPHKGIEFRIDSADLAPERVGSDGKRAEPQRVSGAEPPHPWPSEIARANRQREPAQSQDKSKVRDTGHSM